MRAWVTALILIIIGIVGAWAGYFLGHALGWTTNAEFPFRIGAGERAIGLSIGVSFVSVMVGLWWFVGRPISQLRRLLANGIPGHATVRRLWRTGMTASGFGGKRRQVGFELEVHPDGGPDYAVTAFGVLSDDEEAGLKPGAEVSVRYDPAHPDRVAVVGPMAPQAG